MSVAVPTAYEPTVAYGEGPYTHGDRDDFRAIPDGAGSLGGSVWFRIESRPPLADWYALVGQRLAVIREMPDDWDCAGGAAPEPAAVDEAAMLLERLAATPGVPKPLVEANRAGAVQMLWESADRQRSFEVEVPGDGTVTWYFLDRAARQEEEREDEDLGGCLSGFTPLILKATA